MTSPPAFQFYARDWLADSKVRQLRLDERGAYIDLLAVQWNEGQIPMDELAAAMCIGIHPETWPEWRDRIWPRVVTFFPNGRNERLWKIRQERDAYLERRRLAGRKGGNARAAKLHETGALGSTATNVLVAKRSSASASASAIDNVPNGTADAAVEKWNDILAPLCRTAGGEANVANWLAWCRRQIGMGVRVAELEEDIGGLVALRDSGRLKWIGKGEPCRPAAIERLPMGERDQLRKAYRGVK